MSFAAAIQNHRAFFARGGTRPAEFRREQLQKLAAALERHEPSLLAALQADLHKSPFQGYSTELGPIHAEIRHALKNLRRWSAPRRRRTPWFVAPARGWIQPEPFGVALILGPWNYPAYLLLTPLVSAIAAGNCAVLKPSELAPRSAEAIAALVKDTFPPEFISTALGGAETATVLLAERFDKIFFTGSTNIGRIVAAAAARHLTPVTLELGGKCPTIVCADADLELAAKRVAWGKFMNAGQTCIAPDFVLLPRGARERFVAALKKSLQDFYGEDAGKSPDYGRIVNARHFERLVNYLRDGRVAHGGAHEASTLYVAPTVLVDASPESPVMQEEIFGPILPVLEFDRLDDALALLRGRPAPLALYLFSNDRALETRVLGEVPSGGACINDTISHMIGTGLPFGGRGESGLGSYHGHAGFKAFSRQRAVLRRATWLDTPFRYPPERLPLAGLKRAMRFFLGD